MQLNFDATQYDPSSAISLCLPLDDYYFSIVKVEAEQTKNKAGEGYLTVHLRIEQGPFKGTVQKDRFNLWNSNPQAVQIANRELSALCHVVGRLHLATEQDLLGGQGRAAIGPQIDNEKYSEVKQYKMLDGSLPSAGTHNAPTQTATAPPAFAANNSPAPSGPPPFAAPAQNDVQANPFAAPAANASATPASNVPPWAR